MRLFLTRKNDRYNLHDCRCGIDHNTGDRSCSSVFHVSYKHLGSSVGPGSRFVRCIRFSSNLWAHARRFTSSLVAHSKKGLSLLALSVFVMGTLFVFPVSATVVVQQLDSFQSRFITTSQPYSVQRIGNGFDANLKSFSLIVSGGTNMDAHLGDLVLRVCSNSDYDPAGTGCSNSSSTGTLPPTITGSPATIDGTSKHELTWTYPTGFLAVTSTQYLYLELRGTGGAQSYTVYGCSNECYPPGFWTLLSSTDLYFKIYDDAGNPVVGTDFQATGQNNTNSLVPTSTSANTYTSFIPSVGFSGSYTASSTRSMQNKVDTFLGSSTGTFPMCIVYPWFTLIDVFQANTSSGTSQSITINAAGIIPTSTWSLSSLPTFIASVGAKTFIDDTVRFIEPLLWLSLGLFIFVDLFGHKTEEHE